MRMRLEDLPDEYRRQAAEQMGPMSGLSGLPGRVAGQPGSVGLGGPEEDWTGSEATLQAVCEQVLRAMRLPYYHPYDARRSNAGWPDLTVALPGGRVAFIELKNAKGMQADEQVECMGALVANGHYYGVARSPRQMVRMLDEARCMGNTPNAS